MASATFDTVTKVFEGDERVIAVDGLSIDVEEGEFLVLVGPSGCGKSTTLRLLAGLETISDGEIRIGENVVNDAKPKDRDIAMVFQNYALYPHMTVRENMGFGLSMTTDLPDSEVRERVEEAAEMLGISELLNRKPGALSGGQKQRVALGRAIVREPTVFLMDEPLSNLDAKLRTEMRTELQELHQRLGVATVYVTHDQTEAMTMGDRIAVLNDGKLQQIGTPLECYHTPANTFVAGFIGSPSMNFIDVTYDESSGVGRVAELEYGFHERQRENLMRFDADSITLGIRPEDIELAESSGPETVEAEIRVVEPMGSQSVLHLSVADREIVASISGDFLVNSGEKVRLRFPHDKLHAFDSEGEAIFNREEASDEIPAAVRL